MPLPSSSSVDASIPYITECVRHGVFDGAGLAFPSAQINHWHPCTSVEFDFGLENGHR